MGTRSDAALLLTAVLSACAPPASVRLAPVIYGEDDRVEILDDEHAALVARGTSSVVAIVDRSRFCEDDPIRWDAPTLGAFRNVCDGERFVDQPVLAQCSATLVDRDLLLTARHCLPDAVACASARFVPGLHLEDGALRAVTREEVYACRTLLPVEGRDLVWVVLDRPVPPPWEPAPLGAAEVGAPLHVIGFPTGLPMKSAHACSVRDHYAPSDLFRMDCDLFAGSSGSGVFGADGALYGVYTQGAGDYVPRAPGECMVPLRFDQDGHRSDGTGTPQYGVFQPAMAALAALCASDRPTVLCDRPPRCGDGVCSLGEREVSCADCAPDVCGDGVCSPTEDAACVADCGEAPVCAAPDAGSPDAGAVDAGSKDAGASDAAAGAPSVVSCAATVPTRVPWFVWLWLALGGAYRGHRRREKCDGSN